MDASGSSDCCRVTFSEQRVTLLMKQCGRMRSREYHSCSHQCMAQLLSSPPRNFYCAVKGSTQAPTIELTIERELLHKVPLLFDIDSSAVPQVEPAETDGTTTEDDQKISDKSGRVAHFEPPCSIWGFVSLLLLVDEEVSLRKWFDKDSNPDLPAQTLRALQALPAEYSCSVFSVLQSESHSFPSALESAVHLPQDLLAKFLASSPSQLNLSKAKLSPAEYVTVLSTLSWLDPHTITGLYLGSLQETDSNVAHITQRIESLAKDVAASGRRCPIAQLRDVPPCSFCNPSTRPSSFGHGQFFNFSANEEHSKRIDVILRRRCGHNLPNSRDFPVFISTPQDSESHISISLDDIPCQANALAAQLRSIEPQAPKVNIFPSLCGASAHLKNLQTLSFNGLTIFPNYIPSLGQVFLNLSRGLKCLKLVSFLPPAHTPFTDQHKEALLNAVLLLTKLKELYMPEWETFLNGSVGYVWDVLEEMQELPFLEGIIVPSVSKTSAFPNFLPFRAERFGDALCP